MSESVVLPYLVQRSGTQNPVDWEYAAACGSDDVTDGRLASRGWFELLAGSDRVHAALASVHGLQRLDRRPALGLLCAARPQPVKSKGIVSSEPKAAVPDREPIGLRAEIGTGTWLIGTLVLSDCPYVVGDLQSYLEGTTAPEHWQHGVLVLVRHSGFAIALRVDAVFGPFVASIPECTSGASPASVAGEGREAARAARPSAVQCRYDLGDLLKESSLLLGCQRAQELKNP